jgi:RimJ/RimL family protein N-acetyltransferase
MTAARRRSKPAAKARRSAARIVLAPIVRADAPTLFAWINDRELVLLSAPYRPVHEPSHRAWLEHAASRTDGVTFAIRLATSRRLIGICQLNGVHPIHRSAELQIRIGDPRWRERGLGTEAVRRLVAFAFEDLNLHRVFLHVFATNARAVRAYRRAGFAVEGTLREAVHVDGRYVDVLVMSILRKAPRG